MIELSIEPEIIFYIGNLPITNTLFFSFFISSLIFLLFFIFLSRPRLYPKRIQNFFEWILESILKYVRSLVDEKNASYEIFPIVATLFILIFVSNILEIVPGLGVFHFLRSPSSDLNFTLALSLSSMVFVHILAARKLGLLSHLGKFLNIKNPLSFFIGILESFSELSRILSLSLRLFGNLFAGETLLIVVSFLFPLIFPLPFLLLEILVAFVQALIFSSLVAIFYYNAIKVH